MKVEFTWIQADFLLFHQRGRQLARRGRRLARSRPSAPAGLQADDWIILVLVIGGLVVSFAAAIFLTIFSSLIWLSGVVIVGAFLALIVKSAYFPPSSESITRLYESKPENQLPMQAIVDGEGFHFIKAQSRSDIAWPGILGVVSTHELLAVLDQDKVAHCIPRRALTEDEATAFVAAIEEHLADASRATQDDGPQRALA